jgi:hypothetical protein
MAEISRPEAFALLIGIRTARTQGCVLHLLAKSQQDVHFVAVIACTLRLLGRQYHVHLSITTTSSVQYSVYKCSDAIGDALHDPCCCTATSVQQ